MLSVLKLIIFSVTVTLSCVTSTRVINYNKNDTDYNNYISLTNMSRPFTDDCICVYTVYCHSKSPTFAQVKSPYMTFY